MAQKDDPGPTDGSARGSAESAGSKARQVADEIRARIGSGRLKPGDSLPPESTLMGTHGVSQPTMRAALRILESEGLVRIKRGAGGGPRVQELDVDVLAKQAGLYLQVAGADLADLLESLVLLQPGAVALAAERRTKKQLTALRRCASRAQASTTMSEFSDAAADFVVLLLEASGNKSLKLWALMTGSLIRQGIHRRLDDRPVGEAMVWNADRFGEIVDLLEAGEGQAAAALWHAQMLMTTAPVDPNTRLKWVSGEPVPEAAPRRAPARPRAR
ncbi:MAG: FadR/GntR family transcriptional regulator [Acidimicrobiia bacterium]